MENELLEFERFLSILSQLLSANNAEHCDQIFKDANSDDYRQGDRPLHIRICQEYVFIPRKHASYEIQFMVGTFDNGNLKVTIDGSQNHARPHIHIGHKENYHAVSIALDDISILIDSGDIASWKVGRIVEWVFENQEVLNKMWRCIQPWGDTTSANKRKSKLTDPDL